MTINSVISYPTPPYSNPPIEPQYYQPSRFQISNIQIGTTTIITATANMNYVVAQQVRILVPNGYGCRQINELTGFVLSLPNPNQVEVSINSNFFDPFVNTNLNQVPQIVAIGDINSGAINTANTNNETNIPGSFINISPL